MPPRPDHPSPRLSRAALWLWLCASLFAVLACRLAGAPAATPTPTDCPQPASGAEACMPASPVRSIATRLPSASSQPEVSLSLTPQSSVAAATPTPALSAPPVQTSTAAVALPVATPCSADLCTYTTPLFLKRPIAAPPGNNQVDVTYRFGSTQGGQRDPHHGVELLNSYGTPVLAAADGKVVVAGTDKDPTSPAGAWPITYYGPYMNFYGNLVVIEHPLSDALRQEFPDLAGPFYTLYGHLSEISVQVGQDVQAGQMIGKVGQAGIATGPHLHFEVRLGADSYKNSHNPETWLKPHLGKNGQPLGAITGRFLDSYGNSLEMTDIVLQHLPDGPDGPSDFEVTLMTYEEKGLRGQPPFYDSFGAGDLPPGLYRISFPMGGLRRELVQILPGALTVVTYR